MAAPKQTLDQVDDTTDSLVESMGEVQTTMALLHSTVGDLIKSMAEILKSMAEMKAVLQPTTESQVTVDQDLPAAPTKQPTAVDNSIDKKQQSRYIHVNKVQIEMPVFDGLDVNLWILRADRYLGLGNFTETEKLRLAYVSVDGAALSWFNFCENHQPFVDWNDFKSQLIARFGGLDTRSAMERLLNLKQEGSVVDYLGQFEELASYLSDSDSPDMFFEAVFVNGLKEEIRDMLPLFEPKGINNIIKMARKLENSPFCRKLD